MTFYNGSAGVVENTTLLNQTVSANSTPFDVDGQWQDILDYIQPQFYQWIFLFLFMVIFLVGTVGNLLVCYSVWRSRSLKTVTNYFLVNLAVSDFLVILVCLPPSVVNDTLNSWFMGVVMCKLIMYLQEVSVFVSVLTLTAISVERYLAICHPLRHRGPFMKTGPIICAIWAIALITPIIVFFNYDVSPNDVVHESLRPWMSSCNAEDIQLEMWYWVFLLIAFYLLPLIVMSFTYSKIALCLWASISGHNNISQNLQTESANEQLQTRRRTAKMLIVVVIIFGICYLPIYVLNIANQMGLLKPYQDNKPLMICMFWTIRILTYFNSAINPVIYNFMSVKFQKQFKTACFGCYVAMRFCCCCLRKSEYTDDHHSEVPRQSMYSSISRTNHVRMTSINEPSASKRNSSY